MTRGEIVNELVRAARGAEDLATALEASSERHWKEYDACAHTPAPQATSVLHERALELYPHVVENANEARRLRAEAGVFRAAALLIGEGIIP